MEFIRKLQRQSSKIRLETLSTSTEGRKVPLLVIGDPAPTSPADLKFDDRAVVYFQANIHAGEVEGKEAALMLARDILQGKTPNYLDKLVLFIAPIFNADGNEKISPDNRSDQKGPEKGVGIRYNGQNLDLNRDGMKLESPEVAGLVENALIRWDPVFFLDAHTHNGSYHEEPVTWTWGLNPNGDTTIFDYMAKTLWPAVEKLMREQYGTLTIPHGDFMDVRNPEKGWVPLGPQPRYLSNYVGLRNRLSVLNEQYPYADFETRVRGCYNLLRSFLDFCHANRDEIVALVKEADRKTIERAANPKESDVFITEYDWEPIEQRFDILGYEMEVTETGGPWPRVPTDRTEKNLRQCAVLREVHTQTDGSIPQGLFHCRPRSERHREDSPARDHRGTTHRTGQARSRSVQRDRDRRLRTIQPRPLPHDSPRRILDEGKGISRRDILCQHRSASRRPGGLPAGAGIGRRPDRLEHVRPLPGVPVEP